MVGIVHIAIVDVAIVDIDDIASQISRSSSLMQQVPYRGQWKANGWPVTMYEMTAPGERVPPPGPPPSQAAPAHGPEEEPSPVNGQAAAPAPQTTPPTPPPIRVETPGGVTLWFSVCD